MQEEKRRLQAEIDELRRQHDSLLRDAERQRRVEAECHSDSAVQDNRRNRSRSRSPRPESSRTRSPSPSGNAA